MGARVYRVRMAGSGTIMFNKGRYGAYAPGKQYARGQLIGWFPSRYEARRALEKWLLEQTRVAS